MARSKSPVVGRNEYNFLRHACESHLDLLERNYSSTTFDSVNEENRFGKNVLAKVLLSSGYMFAKSVPKAQRAEVYPSTPTLILNKEEIAYIQHVVDEHCDFLEDHISIPYSADGRGDAILASNLMDKLRTIYRARTGEDINTDTEEKDIPEMGLDAILGL